MTTPTANPIPSKSPQDLLFNAEKIDEIVNSPSATYLDRFGVPRLTLAGVAAGGTDTGIEELTGRLTQQESAAKDFWAAVRGNQRDVHVFIKGDSTGNDPTEWPRKLAQLLGPLIPTHDFKYRLFGLGQTVANGGTETWGSYETIQTGTGPMLPDASKNTVYFHNASVAGVNSWFFMGAREAVIFDGTKPDVVFDNLGHNHGTGSEEDIILAETIISLSRMRFLAPQAAMIVMLQNPRTDLPDSTNINTNGPGFSARAVSARRRAASLHGAAVVDYYTPFKKVDDASIYMGDTVHPNEAGADTLIVPAVMRVMAEPADLTGPSPTYINPLEEAGQNLASNGRFSFWKGAAPDDFSFVNCTPSKDLSKSDGALYSCKVTINAGTDPAIFQDLTRHLAQYRGTTVCLAVLMERSTTAGLLTSRVALETTNNDDNPNFTSFPREVPAASGPEVAYAFVTIKRNATEFKLRIYAGAADGSDSGKSFNLYWVSVVPGLLPRSASREDVRNQFVLDYYADANAGKVSGTGGTLTAAAGVLTLTGASGASDCYVNAPSLTPGKQYRAKFNGNDCTGNTGGNWYIRNGANGGVSDIASSTWTEGSAASIVFTAPSNPVSVRVSGYTGTTGFILDQWSITPVESGISTPVSIPLTSCKSAAGAGLTTTASAGNFRIKNTHGTETYLEGEGANGGSVNDSFTVEVPLPQDYVGGRDVTITVNAQYAGSGVAGSTKSLTLDARRIGDDGAQGAVSLAPSAVTLTGAAADYALAISGATLSTGGRLALKLTGLLQETGGVNILNIRVNSLRLS